MNKVILIGRLTKDLELKKTASGISVIQFTLAVNRPFKNAQGEYEADFLDCVAWRQTADYMADYLQKGYQIAVSGSLQKRSYVALDNSTRYVTEVIVDSVQNLTPLERKEEANPYDFDDIPF